MRIEDSALQAASSSVGLAELHHAYSNTPEGQHLTGRVRYGPYKPEHVTNKKWVDLLGMDVDNLQHMPATLVVMDDFLRDSPHDEFSVQEGQMLRLAAMIHDWGEGIPGHEDIITGKKTEADYESEHEAVMEFLDREFGDLDPELKDALRGIYTNVVSDRESRLGRAFNAVERMGHMRTAMRAWDKSLEVEDPHLKNAFRWIGVDVVSHHIPKLLELSDYFEEWSPLPRKSF